VTMATRPLTAAGTVKVVRFNWPKYAAAGFLAAASTAAMAAVPGPITAMLWLIGGTGAIWTVTSLGATWWIYDRQRVYDQVAVGLGPVGDWASVHAGFDDATAILAAVIGRQPQDVVELSVGASPSLGRAREHGSHDEVTGATDDIPLATASLDSIFVTFAVHEVRAGPDQRALFHELRRVLRPGGRLVVTEHLRDLANLAVYGPGAFHFQPAGTWIGRAAEAGFDVAGDRSITPFVHRMVWRR
jgi:SAM-dependent methyltransferase